MDNLKEHVELIATNLTHGFQDGEVNVDGEPMNAIDYLQDALDVEYTVNGHGEYLGARVLVAFGGPNIWIDTRFNTVEGAWWGDKASAEYKDNIGLDDACRELWECR